MSAFIIACNSQVIPGVKQRPRITDFQCDAGKSQSFLWDTAAPGLGLRATASGAKSYIFQAKLNSQAIRITIGAPATWDIAAAQTEARRLKVVIDNGQDPRQVKAAGLEAEQDARNARQAEKSAMQTQQMRESVTLGMVCRGSPNWKPCYQCISSKPAANWRTP